MKTKIMKRAILLTFAISSLGLVACNNSNDTGGDGGNDEKPDIDYGTMKVDDMILYEGFDGIKINPIFSNPEAVKEEIFTFEPQDECCVVDEEGHVFYIYDGETKINYESEHFNGSFKVTCKKFEDPNFLSKAKSYVRTYKSDGSPTGQSLFLGDSFMEFWKNKTGITRSFNDEFGEYNVRNIGISGTQTKHWRAYQNNLVHPMDPKNIIINIGINDIDDSGCIGEVAARNVQSYIRDLHADFPEAKIYWFTLTRCSGYFAPKWGEYKVCNKKMIEYAKNYDFLEVLDIASLYGEDYAKYQQDGLHPNQEGYNLFKKLILENVNLEKK